MDNSIFGMIEQKTGVKKEDIFKLANSFSNANFQDEKTVRRVIKQVAQTAGKRVPKEIEDKLVNAIINKNIPTNLTQLKNNMK
ncbi:stage VI sporulation protein F [Pseudalkalibacillus caeni]|uniref:Stage VI sporulation protein F n=1 Tax=Exobacillus caeni TaxID=2574798 RepID=A0A5R9F9Q1_9BACL|nr:stage VI sporulation protein F [Pseudalkalibacillus caeni]TLS37284.1 stage VI sporulation protein F [Pseudalkalibacillus caeni]